MESAVVYDTETETVPLGSSAVLMSGLTPGRSGPCVANVAPPSVLRSRAVEPPAVYAKYRLPNSSKVALGSPDPSGRPLPGPATVGVQVLPALCVKAVKIPGSGTGVSAPWFGSLRNPSYAAMKTFAGFVRLMATTGSLWLAGNFEAL